MRSNSQIDMLEKHVRQVRDKVLSEELLSREECLNLISEIENAPLGDDGINKKESKMNIETLVRNFDEYAELSQEKLKKMLETISDGRIPSADEIEVFDKVINELCERYASVCNYAKEQLPEQELPEEGSSISLYCDAIKSSASLAAREKINEMKAVLERFIAVQSMAANLTIALDPFQNEARGLLKRIKNDDELKAEELVDGSLGPALFLKAMEMDDLNTDEGMDLLDELENEHNYPSRVTRGLSGKGYFLANDHEREQVEEEEQSDVTEKNNETAQAAFVADKGELKAEVLDIEEHAPKEPGAESGEGEEPESLVDDNNESEDPEETSFTASVKEKGLILEEEAFGIISSEISNNETKKVSASVFTNDMRKGSERAVKTIIRQVASFPLVSPEILDLKCGMPKDIAEVSLDFLLKKGYLRRYKLIPGGDFFCGSPRLEKSLTYKDASKYIGTRQFKEEDMGIQIEDRASSAAARLALMTLYYNSTENYYEEGIKQFGSTNVVLTESFLFKSFDTSKPDDVEILAGAFWTEYSECDYFIKGLEKLFGNEGESVVRFVFASEDKETAVGILKEIIRYNISAINKSDPYIYSLKDDKYFAFDNGEEIAINKIWQALSGEDENGSRDHAEIPDTGIVTGETDGHDAGKEKEDEEEASGSGFESEVTEEACIVDDMARIYKFLITQKPYCATAYAGALALRDDSFASAYNRIAYALNDPMKHCEYFADKGFELMPDHTSYFAEALIVSFAIRTFFSNQLQYDHKIRGFYDAIKEYKILNEHTSLRNILYKLVEFKGNYQKGMDSYADYRAKSVSQLEKEIKQIQREAKGFYDSTILAKKSEKASQRRFLETKKLMFDRNGEIGEYIKAVADNDREFHPLIADFLQGHFVKEGNLLSEENIDDDLMWDYITTFWDKAGEKMMHRTKSDLMSRLRSNITSVTDKALRILVRWCDLLDREDDNSEDDGALAYKKIKRLLIDDINEAAESMNRDIETGALTDEEHAGAKAILFTLDELMRCLDGSYSNTERRFFYFPFLLTEDVLLDENYYPVLKNNYRDVKSLWPEERIFKHSLCELKDEKSRLEEILKEGGDDYGTARLIVQYLEIMKPEVDVSSYIDDIIAGEEYARETAELKKDQFIGDLELARMHGQIDNADSSEDKKEQILQTVEKCYEDTMDSSNYGFFETVMERYLDEIRRASKKREEYFVKQVEAYRSTTIKGISAEVRDKKLEKIQKAIENQHYTEAEDLLARISQPDDEHINVIEERFLKDFLDDYNDYYKAVASSKTSFATLVNSKTRNKEERGGRRLADNWLPGGSKIGKFRLANLLRGFGFNIDDDSVTQQNPIGRHENYLVKTIVPKDGKREYFTHPIAAFGSGASTNGFRVVCLNGKYDAAGLIDVMKQIGNAKHTMILLDYALDRPERRTLARKSKSELGDKLFVVVDRTVMMYMVRNYDETRANRMLISLITPFGYYQPYVWESSNVMPPEIFMGRKSELESIESPRGANIVYGGRQLGKSALLKKAKSDINGDENGDRSVLIDIKGLDYKETAKKIGHALFDEGVLPEDLNTTDWEELSRIIRKRLQSEKNRIPYLLLLLDEADAFIESCEHVNYKPFDALKEIQSIGEGRFKFVIAGLRNIVRFKRDVALGNNSVLTHLDSMTVKPFQPTEARELMEIPLHYLGLEFPKKNESLITLILATANYFPGLIQMYCAKLLSAMRNKDYAGYEETDTPIYEISDEHIKKVLTDSEFIDQIREKFFITLKLDEDNYYYLIALLMAYLYHNESKTEGYTALDIKKAGESFGISKISGLDDTKLTAFMEELKELNVLRSTDEYHYLFTRLSFLQMMGTVTEVDDKLEEYMEG